MPPTDQKEQDAGIATTTHHTTRTDNFLAVSPAVESMAK